MKILILSTFESKQLLSASLRFYKCHTMIDWRSFFFSTASMAHRTTLTDYTAAVKSGAIFIQRDFHSFHLYYNEKCESVYATIIHVFIYMSIPSTLYLSMHYYLFRQDTINVIIVSTCVKKKSLI